jgi:chromosome segregation ATPase
VKWLRDTFGVDNIVAAELHRDEQTPHIHATVVPIVTGERRKAKEKKAEQGKRTYRKRPANAARLCADDVMTRDNLERFQDTYAEAMAKYGLQRGIRGSEARHITNLEYYRNITANKQALESEIVDLQAAKEVRAQEVEDLSHREQDARTRTEQATAEKQQAESELAGKQSELQRVKGELKTEKFKSSAAEAGTKIADGIGSLFGSSKIERQQQEIEVLHSENDGQKQEIARLNQTIARERAEHQKTTGDLNAELNKIYEWLPDTKPLIRMGEYCRSVGFTDDMVKSLESMQSVRFSGKLYSHEFSQRFETTNSEARLERDHKRPGMFSLLINGTSIVQWFRQKYQEFLRAIGVKVPEIKQNRGQKMG